MIQHANFRKMLTSSEASFTFSFKKAEKKKLKKDNFILNGKYNTDTTYLYNMHTTCIQHAIYTTRKTQSKVGVFGVGL